MCARFHATRRFTTQGIVSGIALFGLVLLPAVSRAQQLRAESYACVCDHPRPLDAVDAKGDSVQTLCDIDALELNLPEAGRYLVCYTVFGNALTANHDGVNAWVAVDGMRAAARALPPPAVGVGYPGSTGIGGCDVVEVGEPGAAQVQVAFNNGKHRAPDEQWGCPMPKDRTVGSYLSVTPLGGE